MAYELAQIADTPSPLTQQRQPIMREEREVSSFSNDEIRYAKALAKLQGKEDPTSKTVQPNINDGVVAESTTGAASLPLSPQLAALARKEQKIRQSEQSIKAKELALETERKEVADLKALKAKLASGDYSDAEKFIDYEKFAQHKIGKDSKSEEMESLRADLAALKTAQEKDVSDRFEAAVNQRRIAIKSLVAENAEFSTIKELKAEDAVVQHILDTWENDEIDLSPEDAAKEVEAALLEKATKWTSLSKLKQNVEVAEKKELPPLKAGMKTLTNNMAATGEIKRPTKPLHLMTESERYAEARRRAEEKLKQRG